MRTPAKARFRPVINRFVSQVLRVTKSQPRYVHKVMKMLNTRTATLAVPYVKQTQSVVGPVNGHVRLPDKLPPRQREHTTPAAEASADEGTTDPNDPDEEIEVVPLDDEPKTSISAPAPPIVAGAREVCRVHGWVGNLKFYRDKHDTCEIGLPPLFEDIFDTSDEDEDEDEDLDEIDVDEDGPDELRDSANKRRRKSPRQLGVPRKRTIPTKQLTKAFMKDAATKLAIEERYQPIANIERPKTRADCIDGPRPCPWVSCRHHLYLEVNPTTGSITFNRPDIEPTDMEHSCSLDEADGGGQTLEQVGFLLNVTRERTRQLEVPALHKLRAGLAEMGIENNEDE